MSQGTVGQLLVDTVVTIASPTTKHAAMVMALLKNPAEFVEEVCSLRKKELTHQ
jgi:hypothetical protein